MKKVWRNLGFVGMGILGHTWYTNWIAGPRVELNDLASKTAPLTDEKKAETTKNMAQFLTQGVVPITSTGILGTPPSSETPTPQKTTGSRTDRMQEVLRTMDAGDPSQVSDAAHKVISIFNESPETDSQERIGLLQIMLQNQTLTLHSDIREFLADLVERYHSAANQDLKVVSNVAFEAYVRTEPDQQAREEFVKRYGDNPTPP